VSEDIFKQASKRLNQTEEVKEEDPQKKLKESISGLFKARKEKKKAEKDEKKHRDYILDHVKADERLKFNDIGFETYLEERNKVSMDKEKLVSYLEEVINENPELSGVLYEETVQKVDDQLLQRYLEDGLIDVNKINEFLETKTSYAAKVKKIK